MSTPASVAPALARRGRPQPFGEGRDGGGVLVVEEGAVAVGARHRVRGGTGRRLRVVALRARFGHEPRAGGRAERGADQERATGLVVLAFLRMAFFSPMVSFPRFFIFLLMGLAGNPNPAPSRGI